MRWFFRKRKTALVFSGGSARGFAHLGVVKVLRREGFKFDMVVGTSTGAIMAAAYALEVPIEKLEKLAFKTTASDIMDITISRMGLNEGNKLEKIIRDIVGDKTFEDAKTPVAITAVDIETGEDVCITSGDLVKAVKASCSLPGIFKPIEFNNRLLIDGGIRQHLPSETARRLGADFIVGVDVGFCVRKGKINNMLGVIMQAIQIMGAELSRHQSGTADLIIAPKLGGGVDQLAFNQSEFIVKKGEEAAEEAVKLLKKYIRVERK